MNEFIERFEAFTISVTKAYKYIQKIKLAEAENIGLKANHIMYMYHLGKNPEGLTSTELSKLCVEDKAAVSRAIVDGIVLGTGTGSSKKSAEQMAAKEALSKQAK